MSKDTFVVLTNACQDIKVIAKPYEMSSAMEFSMSDIDIEVLNVFVKYIEEVTGLKCIMSGYNRYTKTKIILRVTAIGSFGTVDSCLEIHNWMYESIELLTRLTALALRARLDRTQKR